MQSKYLEKTVGLTAPQLLLMQLLSTRNIPTTSGTLAKEMSLSQATVTTILDRLEVRGLVRRERSRSDKRKVHVALSEDGVKTLKLAPTPLQEYFVQQFQSLQDWEQTMIVSALQRIAHMMNAQNLDASPVLDVGPLDRESVPPSTKRRKKSRSSP
ncbi:MAG: MarR family transcriptional regulator [Gammaproteobacteria bacterium]|nr:MarR family transcriptional regulator [Gammaproteobacteria bacterium]